MGLCEKYAKCPVYNGTLDANKGLGAAYKRTYCEGDNTKCARYQVATKVGPEAVPPTMVPNMNAKADEIISNARKNK